MTSQDSDHSTAPDTDDLLDALYGSDLPAPAQLETARVMLRKLEDAIASVKIRVAEIAEQNRSDPDTLATMYWEYGDILATAHLGTYSSIKDVVVPRSSWTYPCSECGTELRVTSRSKLAALRNPTDAVGLPGSPASKGPLCGTCTSAHHAGQAREQNEKVIAYRARVQQLKTMPYADYLQTPEWHERRKARLRVARYRCQVCNRNDRVLNVHHRTYERRGEEYARDLIVLCQPCHYLFHQNGSLAPHAH